MQPTFPQSISGYGLEFEASITLATAKRLLNSLRGDGQGGYQVPRMGHETVLALPKPEHEGRAEIVLQNVGGLLVLASAGVKAEDWETVFGEQFKPWSDKAQARELQRLREAFRTSVAWFFKVDKRDVPQADVEALYPVYERGGLKFNEISDKALMYGYEKQLPREGVESCLDYKLLATDSHPEPAGNAACERPRG